MATAVQEWMVKTVRLIDADALVQALHKAGTVIGEPHFLCRTVYECINNAPTIDAVTVVWCKDCKWSIKDDWICGHPNNNAWNISTEHYCGYGERKDNETD